MDVHVRAWLIGTSAEHKVVQPLSIILQSTDHCPNNELTQTPKTKSERGADNISDNSAPDPIEIEITPGRAPCDGE